MRLAWIHGDDVIRVFNQNGFFSLLIIISSQNVIDIIYRCSDRQHPLGCKAGSSFRLPACGYCSISIFLLLMTSGWDVDDEIKSPARQNLFEIGFPAAVADFMDEQVGDIMLHEECVRFIRREQLIPLTPQAS